MASQSPEPALPAEKSVKPAEVTEKDARNGSDEINGHASPKDASAEPKSPAAPSSKENGDVNGIEVEKTDALAADAAPVSEPTKATPEATSEKPTEAETEPAKPSPEDAEMADVPGDAPAEEQKVASPAPKPIETSPVPDATEKPSSPEAKPDVEMDDGSPAAAVPSTADADASTQETATSDAPAATPADDLNLQPASMSSLAIDAPASPPPATTADTSMSEAPPAPAKVARARDEDDVEAPPAKRAKTNSPESVVDVKTGPADDTMAVDKGTANSTSLYDKDGRPKHLADPSLDGNEITKYQSQKIRTILAQIKKTKAGAQFKTSVAIMWPHLWEDYRRKVSEPTDITTMEKRLKGAGDPEFPPYPTMGAFKRDLQLIYQNSLTFNGAIHTVTAQAKQVWEQVLERMAAVPAVEIQVEEKKAPKQHPTRHTEPRTSTAAQSSPSQAAPRRPSKPAAASPVEKTEIGPAYAIPPNNHGVPLIRRDSTKNADDRPKRPVHPPKSKDFGYDVKKKNKLPLELRFCREVLDELYKHRHHDISQFFKEPVDPVAMSIPHYFKMIKKPMDLGTMSQKLNTGQYVNAREFEKDFLQIVKNTLTFNGPDHIVTVAAVQLEEVFKEEWAKKDAWMAKRAPPPPPPQASASRAKHDEDSEDDDADSEEEEEQKPVKDASTAHLEALQARLKEEQEKLNQLMNAKVPDIGMVEVSQSMIALMQKQVITERQKLAEAPPAKNKKAKQTATKPKKSSGGNKKAGAQGAASSGGAAGGKKAGGAPKKKRLMGHIEKEVISEAIPQLEQSFPLALEKAIDIIKKDTNQNENGDGELELDIEALSQDALTKLYDLSMKHFPNLRADKEAELAAAAPPPVAEPAPKPKPAKPKKNKPMGKAEQEARLRQLSDLKAQLKGRGSNSQEPIESIEGNGGPAAPTQQAFESEEEESSEEE
ncbi:hypothetical protein GE09DRAFT_1166157 [Coniochaeta sp. 2T2.1]|nr:hypothetical protein GE09DRAFT_1166157 [Coniochaeta sp. 2T2.1]